MLHVQLRRQMEVDTKVHNVDQRSRLVRFVHDAVGVLECEQRGSGSEGFVPGTSSVIWPVSMLLCRRLCEQPELVRGKAVVELGAGRDTHALTLAAAVCVLVVERHPPKDKVCACTSHNPDPNPNARPLLNAHSNPDPNADPHPPRHACWSSSGTRQRRRCAHVCAI